MNNRILIGILIAAVLIVGGYLFLSNQPVVSAQGYSSLKAQPDEISIYVQVQTKNSTLQIAQKENSDIAEAVLRNLKYIGVLESEIQISGYQSYPWEEWNGVKSVNKGFIVSQQILIKVKDFSKVQRVVGEVAGAGAFVQSINFELSPEKQNEYKTKAVKAASENAKEKAQAIAEGQGKSLGRLVSLKSDDFNYYPRPYYTAKAEVSSDSGSQEELNQAISNISPQDLEISANVAVEYKLGVF